MQLIMEARKFKFSALASNSFLWFYFNRDERYGKVTGNVLCGKTRGSSGFCSSRSLDAILRHQPANRRCRVLLILPLRRTSLFCSASPMFVDFCNELIDWDERTTCFRNVLFSAEENGGRNSYHIASNSLQGRRQERYTSLRMIFTL